MTNWGGAPGCHRAPTVLPAPPSLCKVRAPELCGFLKADAELRVKVLGKGLVLPHPRDLQQELSHPLDVLDELREDPHGHLRTRGHQCQDIGDPGWAVSPPDVALEKNGSPRLRQLLPFVCAHFPAEGTGDSQDKPGGHPWDTPEPPVPGPGPPWAPLPGRDSTDRVPPQLSSRFWSTWKLWGTRGHPGTASPLSQVTLPPNFRGSSPPQGWHRLKPMKKEWGRMVSLSWRGGQKPWEEPSSPSTPPDPPKVPGRVRQVHLELILSHRHHLVGGCKGGTALGGDSLGSPPNPRPASTSFQGLLSPQHKGLGHNPPLTEVGTRLSSSPGAPRGHQEGGPRAGSPPRTLPRGICCSPPWARSPPRTFSPLTGEPGKFYLAGGGGPAITPGHGETGTPSRGSSR